MPIGINYSTATAGTQATQNNINVGFERVSSGNRINSAADDPAGLAIASRFSSQIDEFSTAIRNAGDGISFTQVADGALTSINQNLSRIRELSVQAANGILNDNDRAALNQEASQLLESTQDILQNSSFNGTNLLNTDSEFNFQIGGAGEAVSLSGDNLAQSLTDLGLDDIDLSTQSGASSAISVLDDSIAATVERASEFGSVANRFETAITQLQGSREDASASRSRIADADLAQELSNLTSELIRNQTQIAVQGQANAQNEQVLQLLR